jgi:hypothetical protein
LISNSSIFPLISPSDIFSINGMTMLLKIIVSVTQIKTLVLNVSKYIITSILVLPTRLAVKLAIILVSAFITAVMLYIYQIRHHISFCCASNKTWCSQTSYCMLVHCFIFLHVYCAIWKFITEKPSSLVNFQLNSACTWRLHIVSVKMYMKAAYHQC